MDFTQGDSMVNRTQASAQPPAPGEQPKPQDNTLLYVGGGIIVLLLIVLGAVVLKKKK